MANELRLKVQINDAEVIKSLGTIDDLATAISKEPYKLRFDVSGLEGATKSMVSLANAQARIKKAEADIVKARQTTQQVWTVSNAAIRQSEELTKQMVEATKTAIQQTAKEAEKTAQVTKKAEADVQKAKEKTTQAEEKTYQAVELTKQMTEATKITVVKSEAEVQKAKEKTRQATEKTAQAQEKTRQEIEKTARSTKSLSSAAETFLGNISAWATSRGISFIKQQFQEALDTLREVNQEMINIRKVSNYSDAELTAIQSGAYDTASRYGVSVTSYLGGVADWAKAGYDNADELAELSTKLELVGDVSSDVATKFLLSADAAWKYKGNIEDLNHVIDAANIIENNFATSIDKIAEGFPIVASTAGAFGMSVDETVAALGTLTAATQESGRKSATALRALILNISKEVGVVEDGVEVTEGSVSKLYEMLEKYEPAALKAAAATGTLVDPMTAVSALAQASADGLLSEAEMALYLGEIGGKLRTNQLLALVNSQEMYEEMLAKTKEAAGSADAEVKAMMEGWNAQLTNLQTAWTKLVDTVFDEGKLVEGIKSITIAINNLTDLIALIAEAKEWVSESEIGFLFENPKAEAIQTTNTLIHALIENRKRQAEAEKENAEAVTEGTTATEQNTESTEKNTAAQQNNTQAAQENAEAISGAAAAKNAYDEAMKAEEHDDAFKNYTAAFKTLQEEIDAGRVNSKAFWASAEFLMGEETLNAMGHSAEAIVEHAAEIAPMFNDADSAGRNLLSTMEEYANKNGDIVDSTGNLVAHVEALADGGWNWFIEDADALASILGVDVEAITAMQEAMRVFSAVTVTGHEEEQEAAEKAQTAIDNVAQTSMDPLVGQVENVTAALDEATQSANNLKGALDIETGGIQGKSGIPITGVGPGFATGTSSAPGGPALVNDGNGPELIADRGSAYIAGGGRPTIVNLSRGARVFTAEQTRSILGRARGGRIPAYAKGRSNKDWTQDADGNLVLFTGPTTNYTPGTTDGKKDSGSGYTAAAAVTAPDMKEVQSLLDDLLKNLDQQAKLAKNEGRYEDMNALYKQAQDEIQKVVDQYLAAGYSETSTEVLTLKNKILDYANKMEDLAAKAWKELESSLSDTLKNLDQQAKLLTNQGDLAGANSVYEKAQKEIQTLIDKYLEAGYSETSTEVLTLQNKLYDYADKVVDLEKEAWKELEDALDDALDEIDQQITLAKHQGDTAKILELYGRAQSLIEKQINDYLAAGYAADSPEILALANRGYGYAESQQGTVDSLWNNLLKAIEGLKDATEDANDLAEKQLAVEEAAQAYENAKNQRTVRIYNPKTGQWEWIADEAALKNARTNLESAQSSLREKELANALEAIKAGGGSVGSILASPYLAANYGSAGQEAQMAFLAALGAWSGSVDRTGSAARSSMFQSTSSDSHDQNYTIGGVTLTREQAEGMTFADLARYLGYADLAS